MRRLRPPLTTAPAPRKTTVVGRPTRKTELVAVSPLKQLRRRPCPSAVIISAIGVTTLICAVVANVNADIDNANINEALSHFDFHRPTPHLRKRPDA